MATAYRSAALLILSSQRIRWGTSERFTLRVAMPQAGVLAAFRRLTQTVRPSAQLAKTGGCLPFWGRVEAPRFHLEPLRARGGLVDVRVDLRANGDTTVVDVELALAIRVVVVASAIVLGLAWVGARVSTSTNEVVAFVAVLAPLVGLLATASIVSVRSGIGDVRRMIVEVLRDPGGEPAQP